MHPPTLSSGAVCWCENYYWTRILERRFMRLSSAGLVPLCLSWAAQEGTPDQSRALEAMIRASAARFESVASYSRLQHYSASDIRFGLKADVVVRLHYDQSEGKTFEVLSRSGS